MNDLFELQDFRNVNFMDIPYEVRKEADVERLRRL